MRGMDCSTSSLMLPTGFCSYAVNMQFRGNVAATRPPFLIMESIFDNEEDKEEFENGNVSGFHAYQPTIPNTQSNLIIAVGSLILAGLVSANTIRWRRLYKGIPSQWQMSFFCQADRFLIWQNGIDLPLVWDGISKSMVLAKDYDNRITSPIPVGNIMAYAHGRLFVATRENIVYAGDYVYSKGLDAVGVLSFEEEQYFNDGGGFGAPAVYGPITGMAVAQKNPSSNGHGPLLVLQARGGWAIQADLPRNEWIANQNIQQIVLTGRGCASPFSIIYANSDIWYRCSDKSISSFKREIASQETWSNRSLSKEVRVFTDYDNGLSLNFSFGLFVDNRILMSVGTRNEESAGYGYHRYGIGLVSLDMDDGSSVVSDQTFSWDGLWTGVRPTGTAELIVESQIFGFVASYDRDKKNRIYIIGSGVKNDRTESGEKEIDSCFINEGVFYNQEKQSITGIDTIKTRFFDAHGFEINISHYFKPDDYLCWSLIPYKEKSRKGRAACKNDKCFNGISGLLSGVTVDKVGSCNSVHRIGGKKPVTTAPWFSILTAIKGAMRIRSIIIEGDMSDEANNEGEAECIREPINCCAPIDQFINYSIHG